VAVKKRELLSKNREAILGLARKHGVADIRVFGSVARGEEKDGSDIDLIVRRIPGSDPFELIELKEALERLLACKVDLITEHRWMRGVLRESIERDAVAL
jgi:predicted nucleotidyltransferase